MGRKKKYHINLTDEEVKRLKATIKRKKTSRSVCRRCQILLDLDEAHGEVLTHKQSARSNGVCEATVAAVILRYVTGGIDGVIKYKRNPNSDNTGRKVDGRAEAKIIQVACGPVPEGHARWTLRLLAEKLKLELEIPVGKDAVRRTLKKNELQPHRKDYWCKGKKGDAEFVARMEDVLDVYERPYDPMVPVVCMDEKPFMLHGEKEEPLPMKPGRVKKVDYQYTRNGTAAIFAFVEPLGGRHYISVREHRTALDWAEEIRYLVDIMYPEAPKIVLVVDNLNIHNISSLYKRYPPEEARRIVKKLEIHYTPVHGSWLNIAEIELNVLTRQCLDRRIESIEKLRRETSAWNTERNTLAAKVNWHFKIGDAREKLVSLYPSFSEGEC